MEPAIISRPHKDEKRMSLPAGTAAVTPGNSRKTKRYAIMHYNEKLYESLEFTCNF